MVLTVLMFGGTRLMAQDNLDVNTTEASQTETPKDEGNLEPMAKEGEGASSVEPGKNADIDGNEANDDEETGETETTEPKAKENENTEVNKTEGEPKEKQEEKTEAKGDANGEKADTPKESGEAKAEEGKDANAQKSLEENKESAKGNGAEDGAPAKAPGAPAKEEPKTGEEGTDKGPKQIDKSADEELKALQEQIKAANDAKDTKKAAELQKQYNEKYLDKLEAAGADKYADDTAKRLKNKDEIALYNEIKEKKKELDAKKEEGKLSQKDIDELNELLGKFNPPRALTDDEKNALNKLQETPYVPGVNNDEGTEGKKLYDAYDKAKKALEDALDPNKTKEPLKKEELDKLVQDFKDAEKALIEGIGSGKVTPNYAEGDPEIYIYPLDSNGQIIREGEKKEQKILENNGTYYIPDDTGLDLLFQVNKNDQPKEFTFTIKNLVPVENPTLPKPRVDLNGLVFLNGKPVELTANKDGSYSFTTNGDKTFGIAQLKFNMPGFRAAFHEGFTLTLTGTEADEVKTTFLITKKGYEDYTNLNGPGLQKPGKDKPGKDEKIPEIDAGATEDNIVDQNTKELHDFFVELKKNNAYIDEVLVNSANGKSLPLSSVKITITAPQNYNGDFADFIHQFGLNYHDNKDGTYTLKLNLEKFNKDEDFKVEDGKLTYKDKKLTNKEFTDAILESTQGKKYVTKEDDEEKIYDVTTTTVLEGTLEGTEYQVRLDKDHKVQSLWKKDRDSYTKVGDFIEGKVTANDGKIYEVRGNDLISYTKAHEVFEGNVSNDENDKADPTVTPTFDGKQVRVTEEGKDGTSYGGTIVKDKIFQKIGDKDLKYLINQEGLKGEPVAWIDDNGKYYAQEAEGLRKVENKVFKDGYIVDGLEYRPGLTLIDKFGRPMRYITVEQAGNSDDQYKFIQNKGDKKQETKVTTSKLDGTCTVTFGGRTITVGKDNEIIFVDNTNYIVTDGHTDIIGNYYYDKEKDKFEEANKENVIGDKFYKDLKKTKKLTRKTIETYDEGKQIVPDKVDRYYGSTKKEDYFEIDGRTYIKKGSKDNPYFESADGGKANIIAGFEGQYVVQTLGDKQVITNEADIFDAVQNAKFAFRYPGFLAGKDILYSAKADVIAKYRDPNQDNEEVSIFGKDAEGNEIESRTITRYFTLKTKEITNPRFFKHKPAEFEEYGIPNYNFFNIFYRDSDDQKRDQLIADLIIRDKAVKDAEKAMNEAVGEKAKEEKKKAYEDLAKENKFYTDLLTVLQGELGKRFNGAKFAVNNKGEVEIQDEDGKAIELDRSLLWEIGFESKKGDLLFPEDKDTSIVVEDYNMDNRLVYDEIIINDTETEWEKAKNNWESDPNNAGKKFAGTDQYFFLNQLANIRFGVSRGYIDGDFIAVGKEFKITREQIEDALGYNTEKVKTEGEIELGLEGKTFTVKLTRDTEKGQIRIKVINAFYKDNKDSSATDHNDKLNNFYSPVQEAYEKQLKQLRGKSNDFKVEQQEADTQNNKSAAEATKEAFQESFKNFIRETYGEDTDCFGTLTHLFEERLKKVKVKDGDKDRDIIDVVKDLNTIREDMVKAMETMDLKYLDSSKGDYKFDDMRFNAIRLELKPNMVIGGAMTPQRTKKFGITSVIVPDVDIPYTDEFAKPMTNKDMYLNKFIKEILKDKKFGKEEKFDDKFEEEGWNTKEDTYVKVMEEAYRRLNADKTINTVPLVTASDEKDKYAWNKYTIKKGNELGKDDLAIDGKPLTNPSGGRINPLYILTEEKDKDGNPVKDKEGKPKTKLVKITELVTDAKVKETLNKKYGEKSIDLIAYYMIKDGYNRPTFANSAQYKLPKQKQGPGIFGEDNNWKEKICYSGPIGKCIEISGGDEEPPTPGKNAKGDDGFKARNDITIDYPESDGKPDEEHPEIDKEHKKSEDKNYPTDDSKPKDPIDIAEKDHKIDFKIDVSVNQMTKEEKQIYDALTGKESQIKEGDYSDNGHYRYQDGTLIMDILPNIFKLTAGENIKLTVDSQKLIDGGSFENEEAVNEWKKGIKYQYVEDLRAYIDGLTDKKQKELLEKAYNKAVKDGEKVQAVIAWLPAFDAPTKTTGHFTFELNNVLVDKKEFKDYLGNGNGEIYTNHAIFKDNGEIYYASTDVPIKKGKEGSVDKYLRIRDKDGNIINGETAKEWFKGNAKLKFGDKFDYKLVYKAETNIQDTSRVGEKLIQVKLKDLFDGGKGFKPVLNDFVQVQDKYKDKFIIKYQIGKESLTKEDIEAKIEADKKAGKDTKLSDIMKDVTEVSVVSADGGVNAGEAPEFILPMMIPNIDAKIEDGKVVYIGKDGEKHELGDAEDFFDLDKLLDKDAEMAFDNSFEDSNTVTVYLEKERFIRVYKEFLDRNGEKLKDLNNLEARFDVYQIIEENGKVIKKEKVGELKANKANDFTDMLDHLPIFKKTTTIEKNGTVKVDKVKYEYKLVEKNADGYDVEYKLLDDDKDQLGFVWQATNTEKPEEPEYPGDNPKKEPKKVTVTIRVNKTWEVLNNGSTPSIEVELYANGKATGKIFTLGNGNWSAVFENLPSKDEDGNEIVYTVVEVGSANGITMIEDRKFEVIYSTNADGSITILNKEVPNEEEKDKKEPKKDEPQDDEGNRDSDQGKKDLPKTGVAEDLASIYFAFVLLLGLVFIKKRYLVK